MTPVLKEAKRLYRLGFAIIWLHPKGKRPIESGWTTGDRKPWAYLQSTYKEGMNVGVRTGQPSKVGGGFLACIDVDIKDPACTKAAMTKLAELQGGQELPEVRSGSGNGSRHLYAWTKSHFKMITVAKEEGWEICIYSDGRQMALPPSIHPSGKPYTWAGLSMEAIPEMTFEGVESVVKAKKAKAGVGQLAPEGSEADFEFIVSDVDIDWLPISAKILGGITDGLDVVDRSNFLLPAAVALHSAGLNENEVLSVLTSPDHFISGCAFDHAQTKDRKAAARWLWRYTVRKVFADRQGSTVFDKVEGDGGYTRLSGEAVEKQTAEILSEINWRQNLSRAKNGKLLSSINNVITILEKDVDLAVVRRNEFAFRDAYSIDTPWGGTKNSSLTDDDTAKIKNWFDHKWGIEPNNGTINDALTVIACLNSYDPVRNWLDDLPTWDGVSRLDSWLIDHFEAQGDPEYLAQVFRKWMTAMVMRVYRPGAKFDWMPIFEGAQGIGKSSFGRVLVGDQYFLDWLPNLGDKDAALGLQGMWAVEMGELSQFRKNELETIKAFLTRTVDKFRPPHGKKLIESARRCVFFGTTNRAEYLRDDSGNRRFKPVKVGRLNFEQLRADRDQLFAEAKMWHEKSREMDLELDGQARVYEAEIHQEKMVEDESDLMLETIVDFIKTEPEFDFKKFRVLDLFGGGCGVLGRWRPDSRNMVFASKALIKLGGKKRFIKGRSHWKLPGVGGSEEGGPTPAEVDFY